MNQPIVHTATGITILGGGKASEKQITRALDLAPCLVAADGGARTALRHGLMPEAVIGDLDSLGRHARAIPKARIHRITEQDSTDFDKCLNAVEAPFAIALGMLGNRLDHSLAALRSIAAHGRFPVIALAGKDVVFLAPERLDLALPVDTRVSLFPLAPVKGQSTGLHWPIRGLDFSPLGRIGTSNRTSESRQTLSFDRPHMLVILPRHHLAEVVQALVPGHAGISSSAR
ncbi:MAG: thiamine diphosphokinase [Rhodobacteraceae bacterium]|nr:thiamine diphosphokinase [Paracoccaceae bacterium]